jgi:hypothetical protein
VVLVGCPACCENTPMPLSVFPISPIYCRPTPAVKLPLFLCPESSIIRVNPRAIRGKTALIHHLEATGVDVDRRLPALRLKNGVVGGISLLRRLQPFERGFFARLDPIIRLYSFSTPVFGLDDSTDRQSVCTICHSMGASRRVWFLSLSLFQPETASD